MSQGRYDEAEAYFIDALAIRREARGDDDLQVALALNNLAGVKRAKGELDEARRLYGESYLIRLAHRGPLHADTAMCEFLMGEVYQDQVLDAQALVMHVRALTTRRTVLHEHHPDLARSREAAATIYVRLGEPDSAEPLLQAVLRRHRDVLGKEHWRTVRARQALVDLYDAWPRSGTAARRRAKKED